jgi:hypothetical protein
MENHGGTMLTEENSFVHQSSLVILPAESPGSKLEEWAKGMMNVALQHFCSYFPSDFLRSVKPYDWGPPAVLPL